MRILTKNTRRLHLLTPLFCSISVLITTQSFATTPTVSLNADAERGNIVESGRIGYIGGSTRLGVSVDKNLQGQVDINQIIAEDDASATSVEGWFGYQLKDKNDATKGVKGGGIKLNHLWADGDGRYQEDAVHKVFAAYDQDANDHAKITAGYGQEQEELFWSGHISKGISSKQIVKGTDKSSKAYDYGVGGEIGTFFEDSLTRLRGGVDYEWGTDQANNEDRPTQTTISAGVQQYFYDSPHSITFDISASKKTGGADSDTTSSNARLGYQYEFAKEGTFQTDRFIKRTRVEIPGTPGIAEIPAIPAKPAKYAKKAIKKPYTKLVKTTMKLENETFFKLNSAKLTPSAKENLLKIAAEIRRNQYSGAIRITGNTCGLGSVKYDQILSERRAKTVRQFLIKQGFNPAHLIARGLGKGHPKYPNGPESGFKNRRVDIEYVTQRTIKKKAYKTEYKNVLISAATKGKPGRVGVMPTPARFIWKTEEIKTTPLWIKRALHNPIHHKRSVDTYQTQTTPAVVPVNDSYTLVNPNSLLDVLTNDGAGLILTQIVVTPAHGTAIIENGQIRYIVNTGDYEGEDSFTYEVKDANGNTQTAIVTLIIPANIGNTAPIAVNDDLSTTINTPITYNIISNDSDADGDTLTLANISTPAYGTVTKNGNEITYTPNTDFSGTDSFTYSISDGNGHEATATVIIKVGENNNKNPIATNDSFTTPSNTAVSIDVLANDSDPEGNHISIDYYSNPAHGQIETVANKLLYTPENNYIGTDNFSYTIINTEGNKATATVNITITNQAPIAMDDAFSTSIDTSKTYDVLSNDKDPEAGILTLKNVSMPSHGQVEIINNNIVYTPQTGNTASTYFTYTVEDEHGATATARVDVTIDTEANQKPILSPNYAAVYGNSSVTIPVLDDDSDPDGDTLSLTRISTHPSYGTAVIIDNRVVYTPNTNDSKQDTFRYEATDQYGHTDTALVTIDIKKHIDQHVGASDDYMQVSVGSTGVTFDVIANDSDSEDHPLTASILVPPNYGTASVSGNNITFIPNANYKGADTLDYKVCDSMNNCDTATLFINGTLQTNSKPIISPIRAFNVTKGQSTPLNIRDFVSDPDGDTVYIATAEALAGSLTFSELLIHYTPEDGATEDRINITVDDDNGGTATATITININP